MEINKKQSIDWDSKIEDLLDFFCKYKDFTTTKWNREDERVSQRPRK